MRHPTDAPGFQPSACLGFVAPARRAGLVCHGPLARMHRHRSMPNNRSKSDGFFSHPRHTISHLVSMSETRVSMPFLVPQPRELTLSGGFLALPPVVPVFVPPEADARLEAAINEFAAPP